MRKQCVKILPPVLYTYIDLYDFSIQVVTDTFFTETHVQRITLVDQLI